MKPYLAFVIASLFAVAGVHAADTHHSLVIHGEFRTVVITNGTANIVSLPVTNATIIKPFITKNTPAKDFDIAIDDTTAEIDLIQKPATASGTATVIAVLGNPSSANTLSELHSTNPKHLGGYEVINDYAISLPTSFAPAYSAELSGTANTNLFLTLGHSPTDSHEFADLTAVDFAGGYGEGTPQAYIISGAASTTSKSYLY